MDVGQGAAFLLEHDGDECTDNHSAVLDFLDDGQAALLSEDHGVDEGEAELHQWICNVLEFLDNHQPITQDTNFIRMSISSLSNLLTELKVHTVLPVTQHLLLDNGSPKNIASEKWLQQAGWRPIQTIQLPDHVQPFRFAGNSISAKFGVCLIAKVRDIKGNQYFLRMFVFALPDTPIPFLVGLQTQRSCGKMLRHRSMVKLFALCSGVNPCMRVHGCTVDLSTCTR